MTTPDPMAGVLVQLGDVLTKLAVLTERHTNLGNAFSQDRSSTRAALGTIKDTLDSLHEVMQHATDQLEKLPALEETVNELELLLPPVVADDAYSPVSTRRWWWDLNPDEDDAPGTREERTKAREEAIADLRDWVDRIYRTHYGYLAKGLGSCWDKHPLALVILDSLSEMWSLLYLSSPRNPGRLSAQNEFQVRVLKELSDQLARECPQGCTLHGGQPMSTSENHDAARVYASHGYPVFPLGANTKVPLADSGGFKDATTDPNQIDRWWKEGPDRNIGIATGERSFDVLDIDKGKGDKPSGYVALNELKRSGLIPQYRTASHTPSGGMHLTFKGSEQASGRLPRHSIDYRAEGGYVVVAPSKVDGKPYEVVQRNRVEPARLDWEKHR